MIDNGGMNMKEDHPTRKILQSLSKMKATPDFEQRLRRAITGRDIKGISQNSQPLWEKFNSVWAYSILSVVVCGVLALYMYVRTGVEPMPTALDVPTGSRSTQKNAPSPPTDDQPSLNQAQTISSSKKNKNSDSARSGVVKKDGEIETQNETYSTVTTSSRTAALPQQSVQVNTMSSAQPPEQTLVESKGENTASSSHVTRRMAIDPSKSTTGTLELKIERDAPTLSPDDKRFIQPRIKDMIGAGITNTPITSSLSDTAKTDSLKKLQKQILQTKSKSKKPFD